MCSSRIEECLEEMAQATEIVHAAHSRYPTETIYSYMLILAYSDVRRLMTELQTLSTIVMPYDSLTGVCRSCRFFANYKQATLDDTTSDAQFEWLYRHDGCWRWEYTVCGMRQPSRVAIIKRVLGLDDDDEE